MIHWHNLKYIVRHKWFVSRECCRLGIPWLGVIHDWSKLLPDEWWAYARFFYASGMPRLAVALRQCPGYTGPTAESVKAAFDLAWLKHQKRNKHHWQYWVLINDTEDTQYLPMPERYIREMVADWRGASAARGADARDWWAAHGYKVMMNENSLRRFRELLGVLP